MRTISTLMKIGLIVGLGVSFSFHYSTTFARTTSEATIRGIVRSDDGRVLRAAVVTVKSRNESISSFTDGTGRYNIAGLKPGSYQVSATAWGYERKQNSKDLTGTVELSFALAPQWQPNRLSSAEWYAFLPKNNDTDQLEYRCMICHNASNLVKHRGSSDEDWQSTVALMGQGVSNDGALVIPRKGAQELLPVLEKYFGPNSPVPTREQVSPPEISNAVLTATLREYDTPHFSFVHSLSVDPVHQQVYFTEIDPASNALGQFDMKTGTITEHVFATKFAEPHNPVVAQDGRVWVAMNYAKEVGLFDPKTGKVSEFSSVVHGHTIDVDWKGNIWMSGPGVVKFDPHTGKSKLYDVLKSAEAANVTNCGTYDLAVGLKNDVWFTSCGSGYIGKLDSETEQMKTYRVPNARAMKGITVDQDGNVWFSSFTDHKLGKLDAKTEQIKLYQPPTAHAGLYGILVDRYNGDIWMSDYEGSHITRFHPQTEEFTEYPLPRPDAMPRFMGQDAQGRIWYTEWRGGFGVLDPGDLPVSRDQE